MPMQDQSPTGIFYLAVNFILGAGVLGLPHAVAAAGIAASALSLVVVAALSLLTCSWLLEAGDRANAVQNHVSSKVVRPLTPHEVVVRHADGGQPRDRPPFATHVAPPATAEPAAEAFCGTATGSSVHDRHLLVCVTWLLQCAPVATTVRPAMRHVCCGISAIRGHP